jgi:hypothetical protein
MSTGQVDTYPQEKVNGAHSTLGFTSVTMPERKQERSRDMGYMCNTQTLKTLLENAIHFQHPFAVKPQTLHRSCISRP